MPPVSFEGPPRGGPSRSRVPGVRLQSDTIGLAARWRRTEVRTGIAALLRAVQATQPCDAVVDRGVRLEHSRDRSLWSNGLTVQSGSVAGEAWNSTSSAARSSRTSASARSCGSTKRAARASAASSRFGERRRWENAAAIGARTARRKRERNPPTRVELEEGRAQQRGVRLCEHVAGADVRELVREDRFELARRERREQAGADRDRRAPRPTTDDAGARKPVVDQLQLRRKDSELRREPIDRRAQERVLRERERPRAEHPEERPVAYRICGARRREANRRRRASLRVDPPAASRAPRRPPRGREREARP